MLLIFNLYLFMRMLQVEVQLNSPCIQRVHGYHTTKLIYRVKITLS